MGQYEVTWKINTEADNLEDACRKIYLAYFKGKDFGEAVCFEAENTETAEFKMVDFNDMPEPTTLNKIRPQVI